MRCYLIDPVLRKITQEDVDINDIASIHRVVGAPGVDFARFSAKGDTVAVDDEGLINGKHEHFFTIDTYAGGQQLLAGKGLVFGINYRGNGRSVAPHCTLQWLRANVRWFVVIANTPYELRDVEQSATPEPRFLFTIAHEIKADWKKMAPYAKPYVDAMLRVNKITDKYGADNAREIVAYFLSNAGTWRGETAKRIKAELRALLETSRDVKPSG